MGTGVREKYHVAINGRGYMLRGAPDRPAYRRDEAQSSVSRLAISDIQYADFSGVGYFYDAQTDWSGGIKSEKLWRDDAKFYYGTNIDTFSEPGAIKLHKKLFKSLEPSQPSSVVCGAEATVAGVTNNYIGTNDDSSGYPLLYKQTTEDGSYVEDIWTDIAGTAFGTSQSNVVAIMGHKDLLWALTSGGGATGVVMTYDGSNWSDRTDEVNTAATPSTLTTAYCMEEIAGRLYVWVADTLNDLISLCYTDDAGANWTQAIDDTTGLRPVDIRYYNGALYYLLAELSGRIELHVVNISTFADTVLRTFYNTQLNGVFIGYHRKLLHVVGGKLIITIPPNEIWTYDGTTLAREFRRDSFKQSIGKEADVELKYGGSQDSNDRVYWGNLVREADGVYHNNKKDTDDSTDWFLYPLFASSTKVYWKGTGADDKLYRDHSGYRETLAKNFVVLNEFSPVVAIDKLLYSLVVMHDAFANANEQISLEYSINDMTTWTSAGTISLATEGSARTKSELMVPNSVIYNKVWVRAKVKGTTTTPVIRDIAVRYKAMPDFKNRWSLRLEMSDGVTLLNKQPSQYTGAELLALLRAEKNTKQIVNFEDVEYVECSLTTAMTSGATSAAVDSSANFPRKGRVRAVSGGIAEEMIYTSADPKALRGIVRGQRGTRARAYLSGQILKSDYGVYIEEVSNDINFLDERKVENVAQVLLVEA